MLQNTSGGCFCSSSGFCLWDYEFFKNTFFEEHLRTAVSELSLIFSKMLIIINTPLSQTVTSSVLSQYSNFICFPLVTLGSWSHLNLALIQFLSVCLWFYLWSMVSQNPKARRCSVRKVFLKISQNSQENTIVRVSFLKTWLWHRCFPVNFAKFLRIPFFIEYHR